MLMLALAMFFTRYFIIGGWLKQASLYFQSIDTMRPVSFAMPANLFSLLVLSSVLIAAAGYVINDYFDLKSDNVNRPGSNKIGKGVSRRMAMFLHILLNGIALLIGLYLAYKCSTWRLVGVQLFSIAALWLYSAYLKKRTGFGDLVISFLMAMIPISVYLYEYYFGFGSLASELGSYLDITILPPVARLDLLPMVILGFGLLAFITNFIRQNFKDLEDLEGDSKSRNHTLAVVWGETNTRYLALALLAMTFVLVGLAQYILYIWNLSLPLWYTTLLVQLPIMVAIVVAIRARSKKQYAILSRLLFGIMIAGVLSMPVFYLEMTL